MLITKYVEMKWNMPCKNYYVQKGYKFTKMGDKFIVDTKDLPEHSSIKVKVKCDLCGEEKEVRYAAYKNSKQMLLNNKYYCNKCSSHINKGYNLDFVKKTLNDIGYELLDYMGYRNVEDKIKFKCNRGHVGITSFRMLKDGCKCKQCYIENIKGSGNPNYNPNLTDEQRADAAKCRNASLENRKWKSDVKKRDNYTCQCCKKRGGILVSHHLDGYNWCIEKRLDLDNGITLCEDCHRKFHGKYGYGYNTMQQYIDFLKDIK